MKGYVIKNKEGDYWCGNDIFSATLDIQKVYICEDFDFISKVINKLSSEGLLKDCEPVEITIAEGDLEQQLAEKDNEINNLKELRKFEIKDKKELRENQLQQIIKLEKKLAEKDKEIEELKTSIDYWQNEVFKKIEVKVAELPNEKVREIRKQVCDEIRKELSKDYPYFDWEDMKDSYLYDISGKEIYDVLDKIEKGEEK